MKSKFRLASLDCKLMRWSSQLQRSKQDARRGASGPDRRPCNHAQSGVRGEFRRIADFALENRLASMFHLREFADVGGLLSYGVDRSGVPRSTSIKF